MHRSYYKTIDIYDSIINYILFTICIWQCFSLFYFLRPTLYLVKVAQMDYALLYSGTNRPKISWCSSILI
jgi:hypothetical protein